MQHVSLRTLLLMVELLLAVTALQYLTMIRPVKAGAHWLAGKSPAAVSAPLESTGSPTIP